MQVVVSSLGWCELAEDDLTPENSSKAVNRYDLPINAVMTRVINYRCIVDLSCKENENVEKRMKLTLRWTKKTSIYQISPRLPKTLTEPVEVKGGR